MDYAWFWRVTKARTKLKLKFKEVGKKSTTDNPWKTVKNIGKYKFFLGTIIQRN